jgi:glutathione S-transferase
MLTLYHSPRSRSSTVVTLIDELGVADRVTVKTVSIPRQDGSGGRDPANPHPEGKVPYLVHDGHGISERGAIMLYLTDLFTEAGMGPAIGDPKRGEYLTWLSWYQGVVEPVLIFQAAGLVHDWLTATFRGPQEVAARLNTALQDGPYLLGDRFSAADLLLHSPFVFFPEATPDDPLIRDWVARCADRPAKWRTKEQDDRLLAA